MDEAKIKHVIEAALLAAGKPLPFDKLASLFAQRGSELDKATLQGALDALASDYKDRGLQLKEVSSGYRIQIRSSMSEWLTPLWEERAPRYTRALLETLALVAYRQPITRAEIEEVRGVAVSTNIMRTLLERDWVRVVGHRDVPGKPAMFGTTREFLDYFGLKRLEDLPPLADVKDGLPELSPQADLIEALEVGSEHDDDEGEAGVEEESAGGEVQVIISNAAATSDDEAAVPGAEGEADAEVSGTVIAAFASEGGSPVGAWEDEVGRTAAPEGLAGEAEAESELGAEAPHAYRAYEAAEAHAEEADADADDADANRIDASAARSADADANAHADAEEANENEAEADADEEEPLPLSRSESS